MPNPLRFTVLTLLLFSATESECYERMIVKFTDSSPPNTESQIYKLAWEYDAFARRHQEVSNVFEIYNIEEDEFEEYIQEINDLPGIEYAENDIILTHYRL